LGYVYANITVAVVYRCVGLFQGPEDGHVCFKCFGWLEVQYRQKSFKTKQHTNLNSQKMCFKTPQEKYTARSAGIDFSSKTFEIEKCILLINDFVSCITKGVWQHCQPASKAADKDTGMEEIFRFSSVQRQQVC